MTKRDVVSWNSVINGCLRNGEFELASEFFGKMGERNVISWNSVITGMVQGGRAKEGIQLFYEMIGLRGEDKVFPDKITLASVVSACASLGWLDYGKWVHGYVLRNGIECDVVIETAMVDMYGKCGNVGLAKRVFEGIFEKDVLAWTSMISVYALHGYGDEAFDLFDEMVACGMKPNPVTFGALLTACAHLGLIERGRWYFNLMRIVYLIQPTVQHYACMVDILGRAGLFDEAERLITNMPMDPDVFVWGALLGACQMHGNVELGEKVAKHLINLDPLNYAFYVTLCDIQAKAGKFQDLEHTRALMDDRGLKKDISGNSMIEVDGTVYEFSIKGSSEVVMEEIRSKASALFEVVVNSVQDGKCAEKDDTPFYQMGEDAEEFRPEKWLHDGIFQHESPFTFTASHGGPRIRIEKEFAYGKMKIMAAFFILVFKFRLVDESKEYINYVHSSHGQRTP
nr:pentatricopeptide repeat-containing protein At5g66520-like [Tanacetum cinerariifolium]